MDTLRKNFLHQYIDTPTRARGTSIPHLLDLVISDEQFIENIDFQAPLGKSDHSVLLISCNVNPSANYLPKKYAFSKGDYTGLRNSLQSVVWEDLLLAHVDNVDDMWEVFKNELLNRIDTFIPKIKSFQQIKKDSWSRPLPPNVRDKISKKHRLWTRYMETRDSAIYKKYKSARNAVTREIRKIVRNEQHEVALQCKSNPKKFWNYINSKRKTKSTIGDLVTTDNYGNTVIAAGNEQKAEVLGSYFSGVFTKENNIPYDTTNIINADETLSHLNCQFGEEIILDKISQLNVCKSPGPDSFHPRVLYELRHELCEPLHIIFTTSYKSGKLPADWRSANITAIYKKGNKKEPKNYRPVSLTSVICKIMESIVRDIIMDNFLSNDLLSNNQYGFIKGRSTVIQLLKIMDEWTYNLDKGIQIDVIYTDFEKAFDKVPHQRLISKLEAYNLNSTLLLWIQDFLCNRKQRVIVNGTYSQWYRVESGIPQGSILGPLLFLIYINDLPNVTQNTDTRIYLYADDAKIYRSITCVEDSQCLQRVIDKVKQWCDEWLLRLLLLRTLYQLL